MLRRLAGMAMSRGGAKQGRRLSSLGLIIALVIASCGAIYIASRPYVSGWPALLAFMACLAAGLYLAQACYDLEGWFEQRERDLYAARLWGQLKDDAAVEPFILYLRPFISTNQIAQTDHHVVPIRSASGAVMNFAAAADRVEFEAEIEGALRAFGPLVALGQPLEHMGAGRIRVEDDEWQDAIARLIDAASLVVLLPSPRPGTSWEVERILTSGALDKTILVDPPNARGADDASYDPVSEWAGVYQSFHAHGFELPEDDPEGQLIWFASDHTPQLAETISLVDGQAHMRSFARRILKSRKLAARSADKEGTREHA